MESTPQPRCRAVLAVSTTGFNRRESAGPTARPLQRSIQPDPANYPRVPPPSGKPARAQPASCRKPPRGSPRPVPTAAAKCRVTAPQAPRPYFRRPTGGGNQPANPRYVRPTPRPISTAAWPGPAPRAQGCSRGLPRPEQGHCGESHLGPQVGRRVPNPDPNPESAQPAPPPRGSLLMEAPREKETPSFPFLHSRPVMRTRPSAPEGAGGPKETPGLPTTTREG